MVRAIRVPPYCAETAPSTRGPARRRTATVRAAAALSFGAFAGPAVAATDDPLVTVPICDLEGHCDRQCSVYADKKSPVRCGW